MASNIEAVKDNKEVAKHQESFYINWEEPSVGIIKANGSKVSKGDFAIVLTNLVEAGKTTGCLAKVKRATQNKERECFFTMESACCKAKFITQLNSSFGSGGMSLSFTEFQFSRFIQFLKAESDGNLPVKQAAIIIGKQPACDVWVLGKNLQIGSDGRIIDPTEYKYVWLDRDLIGAIGNVPSEDLLPKITSPLSTSPLTRFISVLKVALKHNFMQSLFMVGGGIMALHYRKIVNMFSGCPVVVALGPAETGKSTAIKAALSISGCSQSSVYIKGSNAFFVERSAISSLPFAIDEPTKSSAHGNAVDISDLIVHLYNGYKTANLRSGSLKPQSVPLIATNFNIRQDARVVSRTVIVPFAEPRIAPASVEEEESFSELQDLIVSEEASSAIGWAIQLGSDDDMKKQIVKIQKELRGFVGGRKCQNWATVLYFTQQLLRCAGDATTLDDLVQKVSQIEDTSSSSSSTVPQPSASAISVSAEDIVRTSVDEIINDTKRKTLLEVKKFMLCYTTEKGEKCLAVVVEDIKSSLTYSCTDIKTAVINSKMGFRGNVYFVAPDSTSSKIVRNVNTKRRRCIAIELRHFTTEVVNEMTASTDNPSEETAVGPSHQLEEKDEVGKHSNKITKCEPSAASTPSPTHHSASSPVIVISHDPSSSTNDANHPQSTPPDIISQTGPSNSCTTPTDDLQVLSPVMTSTTTSSTSLPQSIQSDDKYHHISRSSDSKEEPGVEAMKRKRKLTTGPGNKTTNAATKKQKISATKSDAVTSKKDFAHTRQTKTRNATSKGTKTSAATSNVPQARQTSRNTKLLAWNKDLNP